MIPLFVVGVLLLGMGLGAAFMLLFWGHVTPVLSVGKVVRLRGSRLDWVLVEATMLGFQKPALTIHFVPKEQHERESSAVRQGHR